MKKLMSSIASVAVAFSMTAHAGMDEKKTTKIDGLDSKETTGTSLVNTGNNLLVNTGNLFIALNNNVEKLPGGVKDKAGELEKCIQDNLAKFQSYKGDTPVTYAMCSLRSGVDAIGIVIEKTTGAAFRITAVPGKLLSDLGRSMFADVATVVDALNDKTLTKIPGMWAYQLGYVVAASAVGAAGIITGDMIQFVSEKGSKVVEVVINGVRTGIEVAHEYAVIIVHYGIRAGEEVKDRAVLVVSDVVVATIDTYANTQCGLASAAKEGSNALLDLFRSDETIAQREADAALRTNACNHEVNVGTELIHAGLRLVTLPVRMFLNESYEQSRRSAEKLAQEKREGKEDYMQYSN